MSYKIITLSDNASQLEQLGTKAKEWYRDENNKLVLFKEGRPHTGENWAEKVCCEVARRLKLPHAEYDLAIQKNRRGVISPSLVPENGRLILGNELLSKFYGDYDASANYKNSQHVLRLVMFILQSKQIAPPLNWIKPEEIRSAASVFIGYLLLDALVSNQDRHHENWGLIVLDKVEVTLAATFDHASSLGRNETDEKRLARLSTKDDGYSVRAYAEKARSGLYEKPSSVKPMSTLMAFVESTKVDKIASDYWVAQLSSLKREDFTDILNAIPDDWISSTARSFACEMLCVNQERILTEYHR